MARRGLLVSTLLAWTLAGAPLPAQNLLANPGFPAGLAEWVNNGPAIISAVHSSLDVAGDPGSGSAEITNTAPDDNGGGQGILQCVPVTPGAAYDTGAFIRIPSGQAHDAIAQVAGFFFEGDDCTLPTAGGFGSSAVSELKDEWVLSQARSIVAPPTARSAWITLWVRKVGDGGGVTVLFDDARFCPAGTCALQLGDVLETVEIPGFRFRVTIETAGGAVPGVMEPVCLAETLCVSGALPGRVEAQLRVIGPRPNGFLWLQVVRFTPSRLVVEAEQLATGKVRHYVLEAIGPADRPVSLEDRTAFLP